MADNFTRTPRERTEIIYNLISSGGSMYLSFGRSVSLQWLTCFLEMSPHLSRLEIRVGFSELLLGIHDEGTYRERDRQRQRQRDRVERTGVRYGALPEVQCSARYDY